MLRRCARGYPSGGSSHAGGPVSYTHLDVYKRQAVYAREKSRVNIGGGNVTGGTAVMVYDSANVTGTGGTLEGKKAAIGKGSSATPVIAVNVSYTHLDVYKRQI